MRWALVVCIVVMPHLAVAQVVITEIMYDQSEGSDSGREWIEIYNATGSGIDLKTWKVFENGKNHKISLVQGDFSPGTFAVVADNAQKFLTDHPAYAGALFDSAFSLNNKGESIAIHDPKGIEHDGVTYTTALGANGTGDTLQKIEIAPGVSLAPGMPTPGAPVPDGGLILSPQKTNASKQKSAKAATPQAVVQGTIEPQEKVESQVATVLASQQPGMSMWLLGVGVLATCGAAGITYARRIRRTEWEIIEEC